jgi:hypothetical protein
VAKRTRPLSQEAIIAVERPDSSGSSNAAPPGRKSKSSSSSKTALERKARSLFKSHLRHRELGKAHYGKSDEVLIAAMKIWPLDVPIRLSETEVRAITDLYKEDIKVFRAHAICRYELVKVKPAVTCKPEEEPATKAAAEA